MARGEDAWLLRFLRGTLGAQDVAEPVDSLGQTAQLIGSYSLREKLMAARATTLTKTAVASVCALIVLAVALLVLPSAIQATPDLSSLQATLQAAQFETRALDGEPWYFCH